MISTFAFKSNSFMDNSQSILFKNISSIEQIVIGPNTFRSFSSLVIECLYNMKSIQIGTHSFETTADSLTNSLTLSNCSSLHSVVIESQTFTQTTDLLLKCCFFFYFLYSPSILNYILYWIWIPTEYWICGARWIRAVIISFNWWKRQCKQSFQTHRSIYQLRKDYLYYQFYYANQSTEQLSKRHFSV